VRVWTQYDWLVIRSSKHGNEISCSIKGGALHNQFFKKDYAVELGITIFIYSLMLYSLALSRFIPNVTFLHLTQGSHFASCFICTYILLCSDLWYLHFHQDSLFHLL
jgi:hypothetical protein